MQLLEFATNHLFLVCLLLSLVTLLLWDVCHGIRTGVQQLSPTEVTTLLNREEALLLDLRPAQDYAAGHIINARNIPAEMLGKEAPTLHKHKTQPLILYCGNGGECGKRGKILLQEGFEKLYSLKGGLQEWKHANLPLSRGD